LVRCVSRLWVYPAGRRIEAFVHVTAAEQAGLSTLRKGQKVSYEFTTGTNGESAASNLAVND
jgi:cold shock CspA family protein